jgi:CheY-like chemotaxis protein
MSKSFCPILIVEDSAEDVSVAVRSLRTAGVDNPIYHCKDGDDALDFLFRRGIHANEARAPRPGLILLDLNLPGKDGRDVLTAIKQSDKLRTIPVVVLTTSDDMRDVIACYRAGANSYVRKPMDLPGFQRAMRRLKDYWFDVAILPSDNV